MNRSFLIWLAGFFDGEGSVAVTRTSAGSGTVHLYIYQKSIGVLRKIQKEVGGTVSNPKYKASRWQKKRRVGRVQWSGNKARKLAALIRPYLLTDKAKKIDKALKTKKPKHYDV